LLELVWLVLLFALPLTLYLLNRQATAQPQELTASEFERYLSTGRINEVIVVKDQLLLTVDKRTADFNKATPKQLAEMWVKHIREVLPGLVPGIYQR